MQRVYRVVLGVACIVPLAFWAVYVVSEPFVGPEPRGGGTSSLWDLYPGFLGMTAMFILLFGVLLSLAFAVRAFQGKGVPVERKTLWGLLLIFLNIFVLPVYWYLFIWKEQPGTPPPEDRP